MKTDFRPGRRGMAFKNGKLYEFSPRHVLVMAVWPHPQAWLKRASHGWKSSRKWADALLSGALFAKGGAYEPVPPDPELGALPAWVDPVFRRLHGIKSACFDLIPNSIRADLLRYDTRKWHLLNLLARCPGAADLSRSNPALAYALASNWVFHKPAATHPMRSARALVNRKQKHILEWLGFPATETARRILAKIAPRSLSVRNLLYLRNALTDPWVTRTLSHAERINDCVLRLTTDARLRRHVTPRLLEDLGVAAEADRSFGPTWRLIADTLSMAERLEWRGCPRQFVSLRRLQRAHDELAVRVDAEWDRLFMPVDFPLPPFADNEVNQPIRTVGKPMEVGKVVRHCVVIPAPAVADGGACLYPLLESVRFPRAKSRMCARRVTPIRWCRHSHT